MKTTTMQLILFATILLGIGTYAYTQSVTVCDPPQRWVDCSQSVDYIHCKPGCF